MRSKNEERKGPSVWDGRGYWHWDFWAWHLRDMKSFDDLFTEQYDPKKHDGHR